MKQTKTNRTRLLLLILVSVILSLGISTQSFAKAQEEESFEEFTDDYTPAQHNSCAGCPSAQSCQSGEGTTAPPWLKYSFLFVLAAGGGAYLFRKYNWKIAGLFVAVVALGFISQKEKCSSNSCQSANACFVSATIPNKVEQDEFTTLEQENDGDEFEEFSDTAAPDNFSDAGSEFEELADDEFSSFSDEATAIEKKTSSSIWADRNFTLSVFVLFLTLLAGILVRFKTTRKLKTFMLLGTMIYLGFINGACPCMISSFQNVVLYIVGVEVKPVLLLWFLGLIPLTYFFGKVWCGWVCHLGALQEFIFRPGVIKVLQTRKSQIILKWVRIVVLVILLAQIITTRTNIFIHYDPFKVAFNLFSANTLGYILLVIMLVSSALIYRPFCRTLCPVGLILGWVSHIPGAAKLSKNDSCIDCKTCSNTCKQNAMVYENKKSLLDNEDCILCGDCMDSCKFSSLKIKGLAK